MVPHQTKAMQQPLGTEEAAIFAEQCLVSVFRASEVEQRNEHFMDVFVVSSRFMKTKTADVQNCDTWLLVGQLSFLFAR